VTAARSTKSLFASETLVTAASRSSGLSNESSSTLIIAGKNLLAVDFKSKMCWLFSSSS